MLFQAYKPLGTLILLVYYNRPILVRNALNSILVSHQHYNSWRLAVLDDGSDIPAEPIVREVMRDHLDRIVFYNTNSTFQDKSKLGATVGRIANQAIVDTDLPIGVTLCDDDELHPLYLKRLDRYFFCNKTVAYCYSNIHLYNPLTQKSQDVNNINGHYNQWSYPIECYGKVDGSQVAFRLDRMKEVGISYEESTVHPNRKENPFLVNLDGELFKQFYEKFGEAQYTGLVAQYKGIHEYQMVFLKEHVLKQEDDLINYHNKVVDLAGVVF